MAGVALAAGAGTRLRPLTLLRPKPLCPVGDAVLLDHVLARLETVTTSVAVNVHHGREAIERHVGQRAHVSVEAERPLGTAGALGKLRPWIDGRPTVVLNADTWSSSGIERLLEGWDGERVRILVVGRGPLTPTTPVAAALMPWQEVARLDAEPSGLYERSWAALAEAGRVETVPVEGRVIDCGTPAGYLAANLAESGGASVIGAGAVVAGLVTRSVVWPNATVDAGEELVDAIRADGGVTVLVR